MGLYRHTNNMQSLKDNVILREAKRKREALIVDATPPSELNEGQASAYSEIIKFIQQDTGEMLLIKGYAGTGKTYLITKFLEYIFTTRQNWQVAMTAPTNKAVKILRKSSHVQKECVTYTTIHSLLGLREQITENGDQIFVETVTDTPNILQFKLLIVDEVSMLSDDLFEKIEQYRDRIKIIFTGDSAQIPPVMNADCIPFKSPTEWNIKTVSLTEIMRQKKGNPIIDVSLAVRENLTEYVLPITRTTTLNEEGKGIVYINSGNEIERESFISQLESHFTDQRFKDDSDYAKVISWTNKSVAQMNKLIRKMIFGSELKKIMVGEKLIANKPIIEIVPKIGKQILFTSNDEFEVVSYEILTDKRFFFYYKTLVESTLINGSKDRKYINILHEDSEPEYNKKLNEIKREAVTESDPARKRSAWRYFYDFMAEYGDINYNYAITCHKSQGSTFQNVFVLESDIDQNKKIVERNRIKYTAFTRPTHKLYIINK